MALPIAPTPILSGKDAEEFDRKIEYGLKNPVYPVPTPKLDNAKRLIKEYADKLKKQCYQVILFYLNLMSINF